MKHLIYDTECTGAQRNHGNPFDPRNKLCTIQSQFQEHTVVWDIEYGEEPYQHKLEAFQKQVDACDTLVGFNLKFDIHWGRRYGLSFGHRKVWDCQLYHFLAGNQRERFPSMDGVAAHWGIEQKLDRVRTEYWEKGLDTDQVPWDILKEYAAWDVSPVNETIYLRQMEEFETLPKNRQKLIRLHMRDLLVLEDMEYNGSKYNANLSKAMGERLLVGIHNIDNYLGSYCPRVPISFNSNQQVSAFLYGGIIKENVKDTFTFYYRDARKQPVEKERWCVKEHVLPRIFNPLDRTEKQKEGIFSVDTTTLQRLRFKAKGFQIEILDKLLARSAMEKQMSTYCFGIPKIMEEMQWQGNLLHGQLNQSVAVTGRLSCSKPNLQNQPESMRVCFESRYKWR